MSLKIELVERASQGEPVAALCREFGISRTTGHKWLNRFRERGYDGLEDGPKRPKNTPLATAEDVVLAVLELREAHPRWGPKKLEVVLRRRLGNDTPSERTIARILRRAGRVRERRRRRPLSLVDRAPRVHAKEANEVWTVDFKGWWRSQNGQRCEPLTVRDAWSRFVLASVIVESTTTEAVEQVFIRLFRKHGVPKAIHVDNGVPFVCVRARAGLSKLSAWWISLGIKLVRSRPGCPQDNGAHERMHVDVRADVQASPAATRANQQRALDRWRQEFNHVRPHQALENRTPAEVYKPANKRPLQEAPYTYPADFITCRVSKSGHVFRDGEAYFVSESLAGRTIGVQLVDALHVNLWFRDVDLGGLEVATAYADAAIGWWFGSRANSEQPSARRRSATSSKAGHGNKNRRCA